MIGRHHAGHGDLIVVEGLGDGPVSAGVFAGDKFRIDEAVLVPLLQFGQGFLHFRLDAGICNLVIPHSKVQFLGAGAPELLHGNVAISTENGV